MAEETIIKGYLVGLSVEEYTLVVDSDGPDGGIFVIHESYVRQKNFDDKDLQKVLGTLVELTLQPGVPVRRYLYSVSPETPSLCMCPERVPGEGFCCARYIFGKPYKTKPDGRLCRPYLRVCE
jgi:hypothetical protein